MNGQQRHSAHRVCFETAACCLAVRQSLRFTWSSAVNPRLSCLTDCDHKTGLCATLVRLKTVWETVLRRVKNESNSCTNKIKRYQYGRCKEEQTGDAKNSQFVAGRPKKMNVQETLHTTVMLSYKMCHGWN